MSFAPCRVSRCLAIAGASLSLLGWSPGAQAQLQNPDAEPWQEAQTAPPAVFSTDQLQAFEVSKDAALSYGIDPKTLTVGNDGVVRYVLVARSAKGALNVLYQGIRCQTAQVKTYGRWNNQSSWNTSPRATVSIKTNEMYCPMVIMGWMPGPSIPIRNCSPKGMSRRYPKSPPTTNAP